MSLSYIATNIEELMDQATPEIQALVHGKEIDETTAILGKLYKIPISSYLALSNIILFILLGALKPEDTVRGIVDILHLPEEDAYRLATDLDKTILEKARISILGKSPKDMVTLSFPQEGRSSSELREEILDTTKREPLLPPIPPQPEATPSVTAATEIPSVSQLKQKVVSGSYSQLMEQLQVLGNIPDDAEITERLKKIQEQITGMEAKDDNSLTSKVALQEFMPKMGETGAVSPEPKSASYSKAPTRYNVDPYREVAGE